MSKKLSIISTLALVGIALLPARAFDVRRATLPLVIYDEGAHGSAYYIPAGYEGNTKAIAVDPAWSDHPHSGRLCMKVQYTAPTDWGGVVWQDPANDWGDQPGGWDLLGAKKLVFWAKGETGTEIVSFQFGVLGPEKKFHDTGTGKLDNVHLSTTWTKYSIDVTDKDLTCIKTGFAFALAGDGAPITFYLDDVKYE